MFYIRYTCGVPHLAYPYLQTPAFIMESITDVVVLCGFEGMPCAPLDKALLVRQNRNYFGTVSRGYSSAVTSALCHPTRAVGHALYLAPMCIGC